MPVFAREFHVSGAESSLPLSLTTGFLAPALIVAGTFSEARGRVPLMLSSLLAAALLTMACAFAPRWGVLLALRALAGISFAGLPAISMAYFSEEVHELDRVGDGSGDRGNGLGRNERSAFTALVADLRRGAGRWP
jgi:YNFM family putative membrane transporter